MQEIDTYKRNSNPHIRITHFYNILTLIITVFTAIAFCLKNFFIFFLNRNFSFLFQSLRAPNFFT